MSHRLQPRLATLALALAAMSVSAQPALVPIQIAPAVLNSPYLTDSDRVIVRNSTGLCWRTGYWTAELAATAAVVGRSLPAGCYCEESMQSAAVCMTPKPIPVTQAPEPISQAPAAPVLMAPTAEKVTIPADALFAFDKAVLTPQGQATLDGLLTKMQGLDLDAVIAAGYADRIGSATYNVDLSTRRAAAIKSYLVDTGGVQASRVFIEGRGQTAPVTGDSCNNMGPERGGNKKLVACLAPDRRVVIEAVGARKH
jgi:OOP family OmpA-OmpF porin